MYNIDNRPVFHSRVSTVAGKVQEGGGCCIDYSCKYCCDKMQSSIFPNLIQAKMGMTEDFEASLQVLRGFDTDISIEVNEIKVTVTMFNFF